MPGGIISDRQQRFLEQLFEDQNLVLSTKKSEQCSVNIHGRFCLKPKSWGNKQLPDNETLLGLFGSETNTGEPVAHFHVTWSAIQWAQVDHVPNPRIHTAYVVRLCRETDPATQEVYIYVYDGK